MITSPRLADTDLTTLLVAFRSTVQTQYKQRSGDITAWSGPLDPVGDALAQVCCRMGERLMTQLNQAPDHYRRMVLQQLGVQPSTANAATTTITFEFVPEFDQPVRLSTGLEVACEATRPEGLQVFSLTQGATVYPALPIAQEALHAFHTLSQTPGKITATPCPTPWKASWDKDPCCLFAFTTAIPDTPVTLVFDDNDGASHGELPWAWETWCDNGWRTCSPVRSDTDATNAPRGTVSFTTAGHTPVEFTLNRPAAKPLHYAEVGLLRCRPVKTKDQRAGEIVDFPGYKGVKSNLNRSLTLPAIQGETITHESLGTSTGLPGQSFRLANIPLNPEKMIIEARLPNQPPLTFTHVADFSRSAGHYNHIHINAALRTVYFTPDLTGSHGAIPPAGAEIVAPSYLTGGGSRGNLPPQSITVLRTPLPQVAAVTNHQAATGGSNAQTYQEAFDAATLVRRQSEQILTRAEYERFALNKGMARAHCFPTDKGIRLLVVPNATAYSDASFTPDQLTPTPQALTDLQDTLKGKQPPEVELDITPVGLRLYTINLEVELTPDAVQNQAKTTIERDLNQHFSPLPAPGNRGKSGWPLNLAPQKGEITGRVNGIRDVSQVKQCDVTSQDSTPLGPTELAFISTINIKFTARQSDTTSLLPGQIPDPPVTDSTPPTTPTPNTPTDRATSDIPDSPYL